MPIRMQEFLQRFAQRRGEMMRLSLIAYRLDHGNYPDVLAKLTPEYTPHGLMADPFTGGMFEYRPQGFDLPTVIDATTRVDDAVPAGTPLLWSVGGSYAEPAEEWAADVGDGPYAIRWTRPRVAGENPDATLLGAEPVHVMNFVPTTMYNVVGPVVFALPKVEERKDEAVKGTLD